MALLSLDHAASRVTVEGEKRRVEDCTGHIHGPGLEAGYIVVSMTFVHIPLAATQSHDSKLPVREVWGCVFLSAHKGGDMGSRSPSMQGCLSLGLLLSVLKGPADTPGQVAPCPCWEDNASHPDATH